MPLPTKLDSICEECFDLSGMDTTALQALCDNVQRLRNEVHQVTSSQLPTLNRAVEQFHEKHLKRPIPVSSKKTILSQPHSVGVLIGGIDGLYLQCKELRAELPPAASRLAKEKATMVQTYAVGYSPHYVQSRSFYAVDTEVEDPKRTIHDTPAARVGQPSPAGTAGHGAASAGHKPSEKAVSTPPAASSPFGVSSAKTASPPPKAAVAGFADALKPAPAATATKTPFGNTLATKGKEGDTKEDEKNPKPAAPPGGFAFGPTLGSVEKKDTTTKPAENTADAATKKSTVPSTTTNAFGGAIDKPPPAFGFGSVDTAKKDKPAAHQEDDGEVKKEAKDEKPKPGGFPAPATTAPGGGFPLATNGNATAVGVAPLSKPSTEEPSSAKPKEATTLVSPFGAMASPLSGKDAAPASFPFGGSPSVAAKPAPKPGGFPFAPTSAANAFAAAPLKPPTTIADGDKKQSETLDKSPSPNPVLPPASGLPFAAAKATQDVSAAGAGNKESTENKAANEAAAIPVKEGFMKLGTVPSQKPADSQGGKAASPPSAFTLAGAPGGGFPKQSSSPAAPFGDVPPPAAAGFAVSAFGKIPAAAGHNTGKTAAFGLGGGSSVPTPVAFGKVAVPPPETKPASPFGPQPAAPAAAESSGGAPDASSSSAPNAAPSASPASGGTPAPGPTPSAAATANTTTTPAASEQGAAFPQSQPAASASGSPGFSQPQQPPAPNAFGQGTQITQGTGFGNAPAQSTLGGFAPTSPQNVFGKAAASSVFGQQSQQQQQQSQSPFAQATTAPAQIPPQQQQQQQQQPQSPFAQPQAQQGTTAPAQIPPQQQQQQGTVGPVPQSAFGQPPQQQPQQQQSAFGQAAASPSAFGQKQPGQSAFGPASQQPKAQGSFAQSPAAGVFGQTAAAAPQASAFMKAPAQSAFANPQQQQSAFGAQQQQSAFAKPAAQSAFAQTAQQGAFGTVPRNAFGQPSQPQQQQQSAFGAASQSAFGQQQQQQPQQQSGGFAAPPVQSAFGGVATSGFGQGAAQQQQGFGTVPQNAFSAGSGGSAFQKSSISSLSGNYAQPTQHTGVFGSH